MLDFQCSPLQESMRLMHTQRRFSLSTSFDTLLSFLLLARNNHEFTPSLQEEDKLGVSHTLPVLVPNQLSFSTLFLPTGLILKEVSAHFLSALC